MLLFIALIIVTELTARFAAEPNGNQKCIEKCVNSTTCTPAQEHLQNCSVKEQYEKCISTCNISNTEKRLLNEHNNTSNANGLVQNNATNQRNLYEEVEANGTLMNSQHYNETIDRHRNGYIIKKIIGTIKNRIRLGLNKLVDILEILSTNSIDNDKFKINNESINENKLKALLNILEGLKEHLPEAENRKVKRDTALSNIGRRMGGYIGENIGKLASRKRTAQGGLTGKLFGKVGAYAGRAMGRKIGKKMADQVANLPSNVLKKLGVFSNEPAYPQMESNPLMKKFCCVQC